MNAQQAPWRPDSRQSAALSWGLPPMAGPTSFVIWCEAVCFDGHGSSWLLGCQFAPSGLAAVRWMCDRAAVMAAQLDREPAQALRTWLRDADRTEHHLADRLDQGETYRVAVTDAGALYTLSLTPSEPAPSRLDWSYLP